MKFDRNKAKEYLEALKEIDKGISIINSGVARLPESWVLREWWMKMSVDGYDEVISKLEILELITGFRWDIANDFSEIFEWIGVKEEVSE